MTARKAGGVANSTVNRTMEVVRAAMRRASYDWDWIAKAPRVVRMLPEPKRRIRWLTREEADRLIGALPQHLAAMARFSLETGLRRSNVTEMVRSTRTWPADHLVQYVDRMSGLRLVQDGKVATCPATGTQ